MVKRQGREELHKTMLLEFHKNLKARVCITDCFQVLCERPANLMARAQTYSYYKIHNSVKFLISIAGVQLFHCVWTNCAYRLSKNIQAFDQRKVINLHRFPVEIVRMAYINSNRVKFLNVALLQLDTQALEMRVVCTHSIGRSH